MAKRRTQEEIIKDKIAKSEEKVHKHKVALEKEQKVLKGLKEELKTLEMKEMLNEIEKNNITADQLKEFINQNKYKQNHNEQQSQSQY